MRAFKTRRVAFTQSSLPGPCNLAILQFLAYPGNNCYLVHWIKRCFR